MRFQKTPTRRACSPASCSAAVIYTAHKPEACESAGQYKCMHGG